MHQKRILIVEDEVESARLTAMLLEAGQYEVDMVHTGADALVKVRENPDLILLDRNLPDMEGIEICRKIREDRQLYNIPIIFLTAMIQPADKIEGLYVGADDYITKPFEHEELLARIDTVLRRGQFERYEPQDKEALLSELRAIIQEEKITPFFQPIFSLKSSEMIGVEGLSRPPKDGRLNNPEFLFKVALNFGMYYDLEMVCWQKAITRWRESQKGGKLFLNCTPYIIENGQFNETYVAKGLIPFKSMVLEITERTAIRNYSVFFENLNEYKKLGLQIAIDDVGSGYASLDTIAESHPEFVKIDMHLVRDIHTSELRQSIVKAIKYFSEMNGIITIAEGIEKEEELKKLIELGIDAGQGYLLGKPGTDIVDKSLVDIC